MGLVNHLLTGMILQVLGMDMLENDRITSEQERGDKYWRRLQGTFVKTFKSITLCFLAAGSPREPLPLKSDVRIHPFLRVSRRIKGHFWCCSAGHTVDVVFCDFFPNPHKSGAKNSLEFVKVVAFYDWPFQVQPASGLPFFFDKTRGVVKKQWVQILPETKTKKAPENGMGLEDEAFLPSFFKGHFGTNFLGFVLLVFFYFLPW